MFTCHRSADHHAVTRLSNTHSDKQMETVVTQPEPSKLNKKRAELRRKLHERKKTTTRPSVATAVQQQQQQQQQEEQRPDKKNNAKFLELPGQTFKDPEQRFRILVDGTMTPEKEASYFAPHDLITHGERCAWTMAAPTGYRTTRTLSVIIREQEEYVQYRENEYAEYVERMETRARDADTRLDAAADRIFELGMRACETTRRMEEMERKMTRRIEEMEQRLAEERQLREELTERMDRMQECPVCLVKSESWSMVMPCGHVFCSGCLSVLSKCPTCRKVVSINKQIYLP